MLVRAASRVFVFICSEEEAFCRIIAAHGFSYNVYQKLLWPIWSQHSQAFFQALKSDPLRQQNVMIIDVTQPPQLSDLVKRAKKFIEIGRGDWMDIKSAHRIPINTVLVETGLRYARVEHRHRAMAAVEKMSWNLKDRYVYI